MKQPLHMLPWLVSRAAGVLAVVLVTVSVLVGLAMAARVLIPPPRKRAAVRLHEHIALAALLAIGVHGASLLADPWLRPGVRGVLVPFAMTYRTAFTGIGILAGYLILLLAPTFYLRRRIGAALWRRLHRLIVLAWLLGVVHTFGAGTDAHTPWLQAIVLLPGAGVVYLFVVRVLERGPGQAQRRSTAPRRQGSARAGSAPEPASQLRV